MDGGANAPWRGYGDVRRESVYTTRAAPTATEKPEDAFKQLVRSRGNAEHPDGGLFGERRIKYMYEWQRKKCDQQPHSGNDRSHYQQRSSH